MQTQVVYVISTLKHHQAQNSRFYANIPVLYMSSELNILFKSGTLREWSLNLIQQELIKDGRSRFSSWPINWNSTNKNRYYYPSEDADWLMTYHCHPPVLHIRKFVFSWLKGRIYSLSLYYIINFTSFKFAYFCMREGDIR